MASTCTDSLWAGRSDGWAGREKEAPYAAEGVAPHIQLLRAKFAAWAPGVDLRGLVFLDEAGTRSCDTMRRRRAPISKPVVEAVKHDRGYPVTMISALTLDGLRGCSHKATQSQPLTR